MLDKRAQAAALKKAEVLAPRYRTELLSARKKSPHEYA
jgi:hypothetical protein